VNKKIVMALDVGTRRIGVAVSDDRQSMALPLETVDATPLRESVRRIGQLMESYDVGEVVVGWPVDMQGRETRAVERVKKVVHRLETEMRKGRMRKVRIHRWDERMSTMAADRLLAEVSITGRRRRDVVDQVAACEILEGFLGSRDQRSEH
jgi:putative holliday junction resolvase